MMEYLVVAGAIFAVNLLPAFGPPTWTLLVFATLEFDLEPVLLVPLGAVAAASGRLTLAEGARHARGLLNPERLTNLDAARDVLTGTRRRTWTGLGLFALSPVPSAQLFVAAGLLAVPLVPLTVAFFAGRLVSYSIYVSAASVAADTLGDVVRNSFSSPIGIALQVLMLALLVVLWRVDWTRVARGRTGISALTT